MDRKVALCVHTLPYRWVTEKCSFCGSQFFHSFFLFSPWTCKPEDRWERTAPTCWIQPIREATAWLLANRNAFSSLKRYNGRREGGGCMGGDATTLRSRGRWTQPSSFYAKQEPPKESTPRRKCQNCSSSNGPLLFKRLNTRPIITSIK